jgi:hypothetical protein
MARSSEDFFVAPPDVPAANIAVTGRLAFGLPRTVDLAAAGQKAMLLFDGVAGQKVSLHVGPSTISGASASILAPGNITIGTSSFNTGGGFIDALTLPVSGTYAVLINPSGTSVGNPAITLNTFTDVTGVLVASGPAVQVATTIPGQNAVLIFSGRAGQRISAQINGVSFTGGSSLYASLRKPDGSIMVDSVYVSSSGAFLDTQTLPASGTYTLRLDPAAAALAKAQAQLFDVPAPVALTGTIGGIATAITTTVPGQNASLRFNGSAAQSITIAATGNTMGCTDLTLRKPDGNKLTSNFTCGSSVSITPPVLPASGDYSIDINPSGASVGAINIRITSP